MTALREGFAFLLPWEFSPAVFVCCVGALALYFRGARGESLPRRIAFGTGVVLVYAVMQTRFDFLSQHMFFIHRIQHLVLHHLGPFLVALAWPLPALAAGLPSPVKRATRAVPGRRAFGTLYRAVQNPLVAPVLFVGLIAFWLTPAVHFDAMLSSPLYAVMNWSMLLDGLLFWLFALDPRMKAEGAVAGFGVRVLIVLVAIVPQILLGAHIALAQRDLYDVYDVCGRVWDVSASDDQRIGGLLIWIPAAMMHVIAALVLIGRWMRTDGRAAREVVPPGARAGH